MALSSPVEKAAGKIDSLVVMQGGTLSCHVVGECKLILVVIHQSQEIPQEAAIAGMKVVPRFVTARQVPLIVMYMAGRAKGYPVDRIRDSLFKKSS